MNESRRCPPQPSVPVLQIYILSLFLLPSTLIYFMLEGLGSPFLGTGPIGFVRLPLSCRIFISPSSPKPSPDLVRASFRLRLRYYRLPSPGRVIFSALFKVVRSFFLSLSPPPFFDVPSSFCVVSSPLPAIVPDFVLRESPGLRTFAASPGRR